MVLFSDEMKEKGRQNFKDYLDKEFKKFKLDNDEKQEIENTISLLQSNKRPATRHHFDIYVGIVNKIRSSELAYQGYITLGKGPNHDILLRKKDEVQKPLIRLADGLKNVLKIRLEDFDQYAKKARRSYLDIHLPHEYAAVRKINGKYYQ